MRDDQVRRYARHILLDEVGGLGQTALLVSAARVALRETEPRAELIAATYLAAGGVGTLAMVGASDAQRRELAAYGPDSRVVDDGGGTASGRTPASSAAEGQRGLIDVVLAPRPAWWPAAAGDGEALAWWRGSLAAIRFMTGVIDAR